MQVSPEIFKEDNKKAWARMAKMSKPTNRFSF